MCSARAPLKIQNFKEPLTWRLELTFRQPWLPEALKATVVSFVMGALAIIAECCNSCEEILTAASTA